MADIKAIYPDEQDWLNSTSARLNGYLGGYGRSDTFDHDIKHLGLSVDGERFLRRRVSGRIRPLTRPIPR